MKEFKVGDRVRYIIEGGNGARIRVGDTGTVCEVGKSCIGVEWDRNVGGHSCQGKAKIGHGWNVMRECLELLNGASEPEDDSKFEVGDIVRVIDNYGWSNTIPEHACGIVRAIRDEATEDDVRVGVEILSHRIGGHDLRETDYIRLKGQGWWFGGKQLEKITAGTGDYEGFEIGDRVRDRGLNKKGTIVMLIGEGTIGVMFDLDQVFNGHNLRDTFGDSTRGWWFTHGNGFEKIYDEPRGEKGKRKDAPKDKPESVPPQEECADKNEVPDVYIFVARDRDGKLFAYMDEPKIDVGGAQYYAARYKKIKNDLFADLKFEDGALKIREGKDDE